MAGERELIVGVIEELRAIGTAAFARAELLMARMDADRAEADVEAQKAEAATLPAPGRGERFYIAYRTAKGGRTKTGAVMALWTEIGPAFKMAWVAAGETAATGKGGAESYAAYLAARSPAAVDGPATPWETLPDQNAWTTAAEALRGA